MDKTLEELFYSSLHGEKVAEVKVQATEPPVPEEAVPVPHPQAVNPGNLFRNVETHPVVLDVVLIKKFQHEWFGWLPETLFHEIERVFRTSIADLNRLKIMAVRTLHVTDSFWDHWEIFEKTVNGLNGIPPLAGVMQPVAMESLFSGIETVNMIRTEEFSDEVARYCAACLLYEHVHYAPKPLDFCQKYISQPMYVCQDCGKRGSALPPFTGQCDACTQKFEHEHPFSLRPDPDLADRGKNLKLELTYDPEPVKARFEALNKLTGEQIYRELKEAPEDVQAAKLIVSEDYKKFRISQLQEQMGSLKGWLETV